MPPWTIRAARPDDLDEICDLLDLFTVDHPSARHPRSRATLHDAYFGTRAIVNLVVAEEGPRLIGMAGWHPTFDSFWAMRGGSADGLYVRREARGRGIAVALLAQVCADVRAWGGAYLQGTYGEQVAPFYERVVKSWRVRETYLSAPTFDRIADLAGRPVRDMARALTGR